MGGGGGWGWSGDTHVYCGIRLKVMKERVEKDNRGEKTGRTIIRIVKGDEEVGER